VANEAQIRKRHNPRHDRLCWVTRR
jgi:hypothetical protein